MRRILTAASAAAAALALASAAAASIVLRVTPRELADTAGLVVEGRVTAVDVRWNGDRSAINTYVSFNVERVHKGDPVGSVVIKVPGGTVGDETLRVEGTAKFAVDDQALVFLWKDGEGDWLVLGEAQGKFRLYDDGATGTRMAENSLQGLCLVVRADPKTGKVGDRETARARKCDLLTRDELVRTVRDSVDEAARRGATTPAGTKDQAGTANDPGAGRDPAPPVTTPDPPTKTESPDGEAPPPPKDDPAPPAGDPDPPEDGESPPSTK